jgi:hypothetical protein
VFVHDDLLRDVISVEARGGHSIHVRFDDGVEGEVDLRAYVEFRGVFAPLADPSYVARAIVDPELGTVVWPNGADLDPLVLYCHVRGVPVPSFDRSPRS